MGVNARLKEYVEQKGIKQSFLCKTTGMSADSISRILNSSRKISADEFLNICSALNVDPRVFAPH